MKIFDTSDLTPEALRSMGGDEVSWIYNGLDCAVTAEVYETLLPQLDNISEGVYSLSKQLQGPILEMNMRGVLVDRWALANYVRDTENTLAELTARMNRIITEGYGLSEPINVGSPQQLQWFLYEYLQLPVKRKRNANGKMVPTTERMALESLEDHFIARPFLKYLLLIRDLTKQLQFLRTEIDLDGKMRCSFNIAGTKTGRLASSHSDYGTGGNMQNINTRLRHIFIAPKGKKLANLDLEQADSRNVGATCWNRFVESYGEQFAGSYLDACESGDLHTQVTRMARPELDWPDDPRRYREFCDQPLEQFRDKSYRDLSKGLGHGSNYMLTPPSAVKKIPGLIVPQVLDFQSRYFGAFPCIPEWHKAVEADLGESATLTTILGRRRYFFGRPDDPKTIREAVAYEGQSPTADEINYGLLALWRACARFPGFGLLVQVHDSILFEYDEACENEIIPTALAALRVPVILARDREFVVPTEAKVGWNWGNASEKNPDGLVKWKGGDSRTRQRSPSLFA